MQPERYHLVLATGGRPVQHGWWASEETARRKFTSWIGAHGHLPGARVNLTDEETSSTLTSWPDQA